jgi:peptidyl-prolyl cis-trans isomerase C
MKKILTIFLVGLITFMFHSCTKKQEEKKQPAAIVASIGTNFITTEELTKVLREFPPSNQYEYLTEEGKRMLVEMIIDWKLMAKEAVKAGLDKGEDIKAKLTKEANGSVVNEQVLSGAYLQYRIKQMEPVTDAEAEQYYLSHKNEFNVPERVKVKRIIFDSKEKVQEAQAAFKKGMSFEEFKKQHPELKIKIDTLWLQHTETGSEMERIAFSLREGELSDVLAAQKGYYVLRVEEKSPGRTQSFDEVKKALSARLQQEREGELVVKIRKDLRAGINININDIILKNYQCKECR